MSLLKLVTDGATFEGITGNTYDGWPRPHRYLYVNSRGEFLDLGEIKRVRQPLILLLSEQHRDALPAQEEPRQQAP